MGKQGVRARQPAAKSGAKNEGSKKKKREKQRSKPRRPRQLSIRRPTCRRPPGKTSVGIIIGTEDQASDVTTHPRSFAVPDCYKIHWTGCLAYGPFCKAPPSHMNNHNFRVFSDVAAALLLKQQRPDLHVDIIYPRDVSAARLAKNDINFIAGYDALCAHLDAAGENFSMIGSAVKARNFIHTVRARASKVCPTPAMQKFGTDKRAYYQRAMDVGVPIAPTAFLGAAAERSAPAVVAIARAQGWDSFVVKPSHGSWNMGVGFFFLTGRGYTEKRALKELEKHLETPEIKESPAVVVQKYIKGFDKHPEVRTFWGPDGKFMYAVANWRAGTVTMTTQKAKIPDKYLEPAKEIGRMAVERMLPGRQLWVTRCDIAVESLGEGKLRFFLNEIDPTGSNNWHSARYPKSVAMMANLFAQAADKVHARSLVHRSPDHTLPPNG